MLTKSQREYLELVRRQAGDVLLPADVLADARNANSPLHALFEWDDSVAAEHWRMFQAKQIVKVVVEASYPRREHVRAVVRVEPRRVVPAAVAGLDGGDTKDALVRDLRALVAQYGGHTSCSGIINEIISVLHNEEKPVDLPKRGGYTTEARDRKKLWEDVGSARINYTEKVPATRSEIAKWALANKLIVGAGSQVSLTAVNAAREKYGLPLFTLSLT